MLLVFDESEVRKIIWECKKVLDYLSVAEVIENLEDLVQFVRDLSPCLSKVSITDSLNGEVAFFNLMKYIYRLPKKSLEEPRI